LTTFPNTRKLVKNTPLCVVLSSRSLEIKCSQTRYFEFDTFHQTLKRVHSTSKIVKNTLLGVVFWTLFSVFGNVVKHVLSCLISCFQVFFSHYAYGAIMKKKRNIYRDISKCVNSLAPLQPRHSAVFIAFIESSISRSSLIV